MTPIEIEQNVSDIDNETLGNKLNYLSYTFCVNADFNNTEAIKNLVSKLEMYSMEALLRIFDDEFGYRPYQNKIYEKTEKIFNDQDSYNINRMMSSLRRTKMIPIDVDNEKYIKWMKNRVKYASKSINELLVNVEDCSYC